MHSSPTHILPTNQTAAVRAHSDALRQRMIKDWARAFALTDIDLTADAACLWLMEVRGVDVVTANECASYVAGHAVHMRSDGPDPFEQIGDALSRAALNGFEDESQDDHSEAHQGKSS